MSGLPASSDRVLVIACGALAHELVRIRKLNDWDHLEIQCLPAELHNTPDRIPAAVLEKIEENRDRYADVFVGYADCGTGGMLDKVLQEKGVRRLPGAHCYEMFAGGALFGRLHEAEIGTFYLTDFLARHFQRLIVEGFALDRHPEMKEMLFGNYRKLVYLAQLDDDQIDITARQAAAYLGLEYERVFTGDDQLQSALAVRVGNA